MLLSMTRIVVNGLPQGSAGTIPFGSEGGEPGASSGLEGVDNDNAEGEQPALAPSSQSVPWCVCVRRLRLLYFVP